VYRRGEYHDHGPLIEHDPDTWQAMGELAVLYPVNGAFFDYGVRFIDPSWGFAMGAGGWLSKALITQLIFPRLAVCSFLARRVSF
jgi:L-asparagine transporter-like permease